MLIRELLKQAAEAFQGQASQVSSGCDLLYSFFTCAAKYFTMSATCTFVQVAAQFLTLYLACMQPWELCKE